jgi:hypothetical protein
MPPVQDQAVVRQHERVSCRIGAAVRVAPIHEPFVPIARGVKEGPDGAGVPATIVDISRGGLGIETTIFLPKSARVEVSLPGMEVGAETARVVLVGTVMRITMINRTPRYYLGLAFVGEDATTQANAAALLTRLRSTAAAMARAGGPTLPPTARPAAASAPPTTPGSSAC